MKQYRKLLYIAIILAFCKHSSFMNECMYVNKSRTLTFIRCTGNILPTKLEACVKFSIFRPFRHDSVIRSQHSDAIVIFTCRVWENGKELLASCNDKEDHCRSILMCHMVDFFLAYHLLLRRRHNHLHSRSHCCFNVYCCRKQAGHWELPLVHGVN
jgi:hypothetical protein